MIAAWLLALRRASFRGVPFRFEETGRSSGRRTSFNEYPLRDIPFAEDLGRKGWQFGINAYVVGPDYLDQRDALIEACIAKGPGELRLQTADALSVICTDCAVSETRTEGGFASFRLQFVESGEMIQPGAERDTIGQIESAVASLIELAGTAFLAVYSVAAAVNTLRGLMVPDIRRASSTLASYRLPDATMQQAGLNADFAAMQNYTPQLASDPPALLQQWTRAMGNFTEAGGADSVATSMLAMQDYSAQSGLNPPIAVAAQAVDNAFAWQDLTHNIALAEFALCVPGLSLASADDAEIMVETVQERFQTALDRTSMVGGGALYAALQDISNACIADITQRGAQLPNLVTYSTPRSMNALRLAYQFYQDANRAGEITRQVKAVNAAFLPVTGRVLAS